MDSPDRLDSTASLTPVVADLRRAVREVAAQSGLHIAVTGRPAVCVDLLHFMRTESVRLLIVPSLIG